LQPFEESTKPREIQSSVHARGYSLPDLLERIYENQLALEDAVMELALQSEKKSLSEVGDNVRGAPFRDR